MSSMALKTHLKFAPMGQYPVPMMDAPGRTSAPADQVNTDHAAALQTVSPCTHLANARRITRDYAGQLRYALGSGWILWTGRFWRIDPTAEGTLATGFVGKLSRTIAAEAQTLLSYAASERDGEKREALFTLAEQRLKWAIQSESERVIASGLKLAKNELLTRELQRYSLALTPLPVTPTKKEDVCTLTPWCSCSCCSSWSPQSDSRRKRPPRRRHGLEDPAEVAPRVDAPAPMDAGTVSPVCGTASGTRFNLEPRANAIPQHTQSVDLLRNRVAAGVDLVVGGSTDLRDLRGCHDGLLREPGCGLWPGIRGAPARYRGHARRRPARRGRRSGP